MILATGCPHSGTVSYTKYLQSKGLDVGHEVVKSDGMVSGYHFHPKLFEFSPGKIVHVRREPQKTLQSLIQCKTFMTDHFTGLLKKLGWPAPGGVYERTAKIYCRIANTVEQIRDETVRIDKITEMPTQNSHIESYWGIEG